MSANLVFQLRLAGQADLRLFEKAYVSAQNYADRLQADYLCAEDYSLDVPLTNAASKMFFQKFQWLNLMEKYERILYLDGDVLVAPNAPNMFELANDGFVAVLESNRAGFHGLVEEFLLEEERDRVVWRSSEGYFDYFNAGVFLVSKGIREEYFSDFRFPNRHVKFHDQTWLNYWIQKKEVPVHWLDCRYNFLVNYHAIVKELDRRFEAFFIHYTGMHKGLIKADYQRLYGNGGGEVTGG